MTTSPPPQLYGCSAFNESGACVAWVEIPASGGGLSELLNLSLEDAEGIAWTFAVVLAVIVLLKVILRPPRKEAVS